MAFKYLIQKQIEAPYPMEQLECVWSQGSRPVADHETLMQASRGTHTRSVDAEHSTATLSVALHGSSAEARWQGWHGAVSSRAENSPVSQAAHTRSVVALGADVSPWPTGHVATSRHSLRSSTGENVAFGHGLHCVLAEALPTTIRPLPIGQVLHVAHGVRSSTLE